MDLDVGKLEFEPAGPVSEAQESSADMRGLRQAASWRKGGRDPLLPQHTHTLQKKLNTSGQGEAFPAKGGIQVWVLRGKKKFPGDGR